jgi:hypothetical protein
MAPSRPEIFSLAEEGALFCGPIGFVSNIDHRDFPETNRLSKIVRREDPSSAVERQRVRAIDSSDHENAL